MATKNRTRKSPEQRQAEAKELHDKLAAQVEALAESGEWQRFLDYAASFHNYSINNLLLIIAQCPHATQVADPFHVVRVANERLDEVRRRVQNETPGHRGHKNDPLYRCRRLLIGLAGAN